MEGGLSFVRVQDPLFFGPNLGGVGPWLVVLVAIFFRGNRCRSGVEILGFDTLKLTTYMAGCSKNTSK